VRADHIGTHCRYRGPGAIPVTFASLEASGSFTDRGTEGMAAPEKVSIKRSRSVMLPSTNVTLGVVDVQPGTVARLSMMTTSWCCDKCDVSLETEQEHRQGATMSARFEMMNPARR